VAYLKPLLDIGMGIVAGPGGRQTGADVRLLLPGRCLVCGGGLEGLEGARAALRTGRIPWRTGDFRTERLGSLRSLNMAAVGHGQILLEHLLTGALRDSTWLQLDLDAAGLPRWAHRSLPVTANCMLCRLSGSGDRGLLRLPELLARL
jgi:hypothetical protein